MSTTETKMAELITKANTEKMCTEKEVSSGSLLGGLGSVTRAAFLLVSGDSYQWCFNFVLK